jgi:hypothetical protein
MSQHAFELIAGVVFLLITLGHVFRVIFGVSLVVYGVSVPMWASGIAIIIMGYLAYEGLRLATKSPSGA